MTKALTVGEQVRVTVDGTGLLHLETAQFAGGERVWSDVVSGDEVVESLEELLAFAQKHCGDT